MIKASIPNVNIPYAEAFIANISIGIKKQAPTIALSLEGCIPFPSRFTVVQRNGELFRRKKTTSFDITMPDFVMTADTLQLGIESDYISVDDTVQPRYIIHKVIILQVHPISR